MADVAHPRLKFVIRYGAYNVHQGDDGTFIAETEDENEDTQFVSRDLVELFAGLDLIADIGALQMPDIPDWAMRFFNDPEEIVLLPSAEPSRTKRVEDTPVSREDAVERCRETMAATSAILLANAHSTSAIEEAIANNLLWTMMPSEIERRYGKWMRNDYVHSRSETVG